MLNHFVEDGGASIRAGYAALAKKFDTCGSWQKKCNLPEADIEKRLRKTKKN